MREMAKKKATLADLALVPPNMVGQIIDGDLLAMSRPVPAHGIAVSQALVDLGTRFGRGSTSGGWFFIIEPELHLDEDVLVPDIAGWKVEKLSRMPTTPGITTPPDWVCEALSPSTASLDRIKKARIYARAGIGWYSIIDPAERSVEVLRLAGGVYTQHSACMLGERLVLEPFSTESFDPVGWWISAEP